MTVRGMFATLVLFLPLAADAIGADVPMVAGFLGDGSGWFKDCTPPTEWSETKNILWKTPLPNWGNSSPIAVKGQVFVTCENGWKSDMPVLLCLDAATGKLLWQRELDHLDQLPDGQQQKTRDAWHQWRGFVREALRWQYAAQFEGKGEEAAKWRKEHRCDGDSDADTEVERGISDVGTPSRDRAVANAFGRSRKDPQFAALEALVRNAGLGIEDYYASGCTYVGNAFPTPVSDGKRVYVVTCFQTVFCFDMEGKAIWKRWFGPRAYSAKAPYAWLTHSPLLMGDRLLTTVNHVARCLDATTGKTLWETRYLDLSDPVFRNLKHCHSVKYSTGSPRHMVLGGVHVLILSPGYVLRLSDGKVLTPLTKLANMSTCGSTDNGQDVVFYYTWENNDKKDIEVDDGLFAAQLSFDGPDALATKILFNPDFNVRLNTSGILYRDGVLYSQRSLWDARTGAELRTIQDRRFGQAHHIVAAGDFFYALDKAGKCGVVKFDRSAAVVAVNPLSPAPHEGEKIEQHACQSARKDWGAYPFTASVPFFQGNRVYIRSHDYLYCIAENP